ncbi:MAG: phosphatidate cytidylyltransferase [Thermoprotei archaeon]
MIATLSDVLWGAVLTAWVAFVVLKLSKWVARLTSIYVSRKVIHIVGGGLVAVLAPFVFSSPFVLIVVSYLLTAYLLVLRVKRKEMNWFMERDSLGEVYYTFSYGTVLLLMWLIEPDYWHTHDIYIALVPIYFMSFGDGVTGIIRNYVYKRRVKGFWGSVGMLVVSAIIGYYYFGPVGLLAGVLATVLEVLNLVDDNLSVTFGTFAFLLAFARL